MLLRFIKDSFEAEKRAALEVWGQHMERLIDGTADDNVVSLALPKVSRRSSPGCISPEPDLTKTALEARLWVIWILTRLRSVANGRVPRGPFKNRRQLLAQVEVPHSPS